MLIETSFREEGICFKPKYKNERITFPMEIRDRKMLLDSDWNGLNILEQIWYQDAFEEDDDGYILTPEAFYSLEEEMREQLPLICYPTVIGLKENGNIGSRNYSISWYVISGGRNAGRCRRKGCIATAGGHDFILSKEQYDLVEAIDHGGPFRSLMEKARFQAEIKYLASKADAVIDSFTEQRDFFFADSVEPALESENDFEISIKPVLDGLPEELSESLPKEIRSVQQFINGRRRRNLFTSNDVVKQYNQISKIPDIVNRDVPRFLENPIAFIPEEIEFDEDLFSKRVKGLKIRTSAAVPYVHIEPREGEEGWFDIDTGIVIHDNSGDAEDVLIEDDPELRQRMAEAVENGEEFFYYNNQWIKVDPNTYEDFIEADRIKTEYLENGAISGNHIRKLLDIYENIDGIEYNEAVFELRKSLFTDIAVALSFNGQLKKYQFEGYQFLRAHYDTKTGVLLADDMGLGKTVQVIALLAYMLDQDSLTPTLLVIPKSLTENWQSELNKFLPAVRTIYCHQGPGRFKSRELIEKCDVVLTTYETLARDQVLLGTIKWSCVVCDEVQKIKNFKTFAASAVKGMNSHCKVAMTGTPVENRLSELWSITDFVQPGLLNSYQFFRNTYEKPIQAGGLEREQKTDELIRVLSPVFLRRTKEDVLGDILPGKNEYSYGLQLSSEQVQLYKAIVNDVKNNEDNIALGAIQKMIMLCSHPRLISKESFSFVQASQLEEESPKLKWTVECLNDIRQKEEKAVIFTKYLDMQAILRRVIFEEFGLDAKIINGAVKENRLEIIKSFSRVKGFNVLILSPKAAGVGLNIVAANHVIHYTREWNPAIENQATDRVYRIGQEKPVTVYYPIMKSDKFTCAEERLDNLLSQKRELMKNVIVPSDLSIKLQDFKDII